MTPVWQWSVRRARWAGLLAGPVMGTLAVLPDGTWRVSRPTGTQPVHLLHAWPCFGWVAIRCRAVAGAAAEIPFELVLYRTGMPSDAWSELRRQVAAHARMRAPRLKDGP